MFENVGTMGTKEVGLGHHDGDVVNPFVFGPLENSDESTHEGCVWVTEEMARLCCICGEEVEYLTLLQLPGRTRYN